MSKFGKVKTKILENISKSFIKNDTKNVKNILSVLSKNKDLKELYVLYEDIENKHFDDEKVVKEYVEELTTLLKSKNKNVSKILKELNNKFDGDVEENELYSILDLLSEEDSILNLDKKIAAKKNLMDFLKIKKDKKEKVDVPQVVNENLLYAVLSNDFNTKFSNVLSEDEKKELKDIISLKDDELNNKVKVLKEDILSKIDSTILESKDNFELMNKLNNVKSEVMNMKNSKYNYFKLKELKNGLN